MPTVFWKGPYRFYFYSHEPGEPIHIHVDRDDLSAKIWLQPISLARNLGFRPHELSRILLLTEKYQTELLEAWYGYFST